MRSRIFVRWYVRPWVGPSVRQSVRRSVGPTQVEFLTKTTKRKEPRGFLEGGEKEENGMQLAEG